MLTPRMSLLDREKVRGGMVCLVPGVCMMQRPFPDHPVMLLALMLSLSSCIYLLQQFEQGMIDVLLFRNTLTPAHHLRLAFPRHLDSTVPLLRLVFEEGFLHSFQVFVTRQICR